MPEYDISYFVPPAPVAQVVLRNHDTGSTISDVLFLIDTGADVTLLPNRAIHQLDLSLHDSLRYELRGFDGSIIFALSVMVELIFLNRIFRGHYLVIEDDHGT